MNKKGDITDSLSFIIIVLVLAVGFFIIAWIVPSITSGLNNSGLNNTDEGANAITRLNTFGTSTIQKGFFFIFIGLCISVLISAFFLDTHPIWFFLYLLMLGITILIAVYLANVYETLITNSAFSSFYESQRMINFVMQNIIKITLGVFALSFIIIFSKFSGYIGGQTRV